MLFDFFFFFLNKYVSKYTIKQTVSLSLFLKFLTGTYLQKEAISQGPKMQRERWFHHVTCVLAFCIQIELLSISVFVFLVIRLKTET